MAYEKRLSPRRHVLQRAILCGGPGAPMKRCIVRDVSESGARVVLAGAQDTSEQFVLYLSPTGAVSRQCRVVWRSENEIGVQFIARADDA